MLNILNALGFISEQTLKKSLYCTDLEIKLNWEIKGLQISSLVLITMLV